MRNIFGSMQDLLGMDGKLRRQDPDAEQINHCENLPYHYWRYRMHLPLETLLGKMGEPLTNDIRAMVYASGRASLY
jgi:4-alpha-glucanotransferase